MGLEKVYPIKPDPLPDTNKMFLLYHSMMFFFKKKANISASFIGKHGLQTVQHLAELGHLTHAKTRQYTNLQPTLRASPLPLPEGSL
jgi:hypothetical protein